MGFVILYLEIVFNIIYAIIYKCHWTIKKSRHKAGKILFCILQRVGNMKSGVTFHTSIVSTQYEHYVNVMLRNSKVLGRLNFFHPDARGGT